MGGVFAFPITYNAGSQNADPGHEYVTTRDSGTCNDAMCAAPSSSAATRDECGQSAIHPHVHRASYVHGSSHRRITI
jgi:hypothetical protein